MTKVKRNRRLLLKTAKRIETVPESYDQANWCQPTDRAPCGTAACLAGELIICSAPTVEEGVKLLRDRYQLPDFPGTSEMAANLAGLTEVETNKLFPGDVGDWPDPYRTRYVAAETQQERAKAAAELLRYLADGGEV